MNVLKYKIKQILSVVFHFLMYSVTSQALADFSSQKTLYGVKLTREDGAETVNFECNEKLPINNVQYCYINYTYLYVEKTRLLPSLNLDEAKSLVDRFYHEKNDYCKSEFLTENYPTTNERQIEYNTLNKANFKSVCSCTNDNWKKCAPAKMVTSGSKEFSTCGIYNFKEFYKFTTQKDGSTIGTPEDDEITGPLCPSGNVYHISFNPDLKSVSRTMTTKEKGRINRKFIPGSVEDRAYGGACAYRKLQSEKTYSTYVSPISPAKCDYIKLEYK